MTAYDIRMAKIINGDMVIGKWDESGRRIEDPAMVQVIPTQQGGVQMMLLPFGYPFEMEITGEISLDHILYEFKSTPEELKNKYLEAVSNLTISSSGDLKNLQNMAAKGKGGNVTDLGSLLK
ncbi:MAG: hypothetical protein ACOC0U_00635 [Desulfovibrionales bacterium]